MTIFLQIGFVAAGWLRAGAVLRANRGSDWFIAAGPTTYGCRDLTHLQERRGYAATVAVADSAKIWTRGVQRVSSTPNGPMEFRYAQGISHSLETMTGACFLPWKLGR